MISLNRKMISLNREMISLFREMISLFREFSIFEGLGFPYSSLNHFMAKLCLRRTEAGEGGRTGRVRGRGS